MDNPKDPSHRNHVDRTGKRHGIKDSWAGSEAKKQTSKPPSAEELKKKMVEAEKAVQSVRRRKEAGDPWINPNPDETRRKELIDLARSAQEHQDIVDKLRAKKSKGGGSRA